MSLTDKYNQIQTHMNTLSTHLTALEVKSKKASAPKARASSQLAKNLLMELRKEIMVYVKAIETKPRKKAEIISPTHSAVQAEEEATDAKEEEVKATTGPLTPKREPGQQKDNSEPEINPSPVVAPSPVISPKKKASRKPRVVKPKTK